jgi:PKD repeat protein
MRQYYFLFVFIFSIQLVFSQENKNIDQDFIGDKEFLNLFENNTEKIFQLEKEFLSKNEKNRMNNDTIFIPVRFIILRNDDGTGGIPEQKIYDAINKANQNFEDSNLWFKRCGKTDYIDKSRFYDFKTQDLEHITKINNIPKTINIYFVNSITQGADFQPSGLAFVKERTGFVIMTNGATNAEGTTLSHEFGHIFGLTHTHGPSNDQLTKELVNGSNCDIEGDLICDTPADPYLFNRVNSDCEFPYTIYDANGDLFHPDTKNIMAYTPCSEYFSPQQVARMNAIYHTYWEQDIRCTPVKCGFEGDVLQSCKNSLRVSFTDHSAGAINWAWDIDNDGIIDYTEKNITHTYTEYGEYTVKLYINSGETELTRTRESYIKVGTEPVITRKVEMSLRHMGANTSVYWRFSDYNGRILYEGRVAEANSEVSRTFYVKPDECYSFQVYDTGGFKSYEYSLTTDRGVVLASESNEKRTYVRTAVFPEETISMYPNPATTEINLLANDHKNIDSYVIYNALGQVVLMKGNYIEDNAKINISTLIPGVYYISIRIKNSENLNYSFIKN